MAILDQLSSKKKEKLRKDKIIWLATITPSNTPHLVPIWHIVHDDRVWCCTGRSSRKYRNLQLHRNVSFALEDGRNPVIGEGVVEFFEKPYPQEVVQKFSKKYDWDITTSEEYDGLIAIDIDRWLMNS